jgi:hypothetical protein
MAVITGPDIVAGHNVNGGSTICGTSVRYPFVTWECHNKLAAAHLWRMLRAAESTLRRRYTPLRRRCGEQAIGRSAEHRHPATVWC